MFHKFFALLGLIVGVIPKVLANERENITGSARWSLLVLLQHRHLDVFRVLVLDLRKPLRDVCVFLVPNALDVDAVLERDVIDVLFVPSVAGQAFVDRAIDF